MWQPSALELNRRVRDMEMLGQALANGGQNSLALLHVHVRNPHVAGDGLQVCANGPNVDVVDFLNIVDTKYRLCHAIQLQISRQTLQQDMTALTQNSQGAPQDHQPYGHPNRRVHPARARPTNRQGTRKNRDVRQRIAKIVNQDAAQVQIFSPANQSQSDSAIDAQREHSDPEHQRGANFDRPRQTLIRFKQNVNGYQDQQNRIDEGSKNSRAMISVGFFFGGRPFGQSNRDPRNKDR